MSAYPPPPSGRRRRNEMRKVHDAEILGPDNGENQDSGHGRGRQCFFGGSGPEGSWHGPGAVFTTVFNYPGSGQNACTGPAISFTLFLICLFGYGFLAGLGFVFFLTLGSLIGSWRGMRQLMAGQETNPWLWRVGNWAVSFFLTVWLAGGMGR